MIVRSVASESGAIIFVLADIAEMPKRADKRPLLTDDPICKISKFCDVIQFLYHDDDDYLLSGSESRIIELIVAKNYSPTQSGVLYLAQLPKLTCKNEAELNAGFTEKQKETFEKFKDCTSELSCITEREAFSSGFILATRIMVEIMEGLGTVEEI